MEDFNSDLDKITDNVTDIDLPETSKQAKVTKVKRPRKALKNEASTPEASALEKMVATLAAKLEVLENEVSLKDEKLAKIEHAQLTREVGEDEFGIGLWKKLTRGKDKGYIRQIYIDAENMVSTSARTRF